MGWHLIKKLLQQRKRESGESLGNGRKSLPVTFEQGIHVQNLERAQKLDPKRTDNTFNKGASEQTVLKSTIANKCVKKFATSPAIGEMQIQTPFHLTPVSLVITKKTSSKY
jgi:hypothetical protein